MTLKNIKGTVLKTVFLPQNIKVTPNIIQGIPDT